MMLLLLWNNGEARYVAPMLPIAGLAAAYTVEWLTAGRPRSVRAGARIGLALAAALVALVNVQLVRLDRGRDASARGSMVSAFRDVSAWIVANTRPNDRILTEYGAGYYLRTGRKTVIAVPEDGGIGRPGVIQTPGIYFAQRILDDTVTLIVNQRPAGLNGVLISKSLSRIAGQCSDVLQPLPPVPPPGDVAPAYYRVVRDERCLRTLAGR